MVKKLKNYSEFYKSIVEKTDEWKEILNEEMLDDYITETEQMQYIMLMARIYETENKELSLSSRHDAHKELVLRCQELDVTDIINYIWELNNGIKHGNINVKKLINILKNPMFKKLFSAEFDTFEGRELNDLLHNNAILFDFNEDILLESDFSRYKEVCDNDLVRITLNINTDDLEKMDSKGELKAIKTMISKGWLAYYYSKYNYPNYSLDPIQTKFHIKYFTGEFCEGYYQLDLFFRIAYFYNELLIKLLNDEKIKIYRKKYIEEEITYREYNA